MEGKSKVLNLAIIGGGLFARLNHVPQILKLHDIIKVVSVWSNSKASADATAALFSYPIDVYFETDSDGVSAAGRQYSDLLARADVHAVDLVIPIDSMPEFVEKALSAGKHVLSEKPMAPTVEIGQEMLKKYHNVHQVAHPGLIWSVAEQFWYEPTYHAAYEHRLKHWPAKVSGDVTSSDLTIPEGDQFSALAHIGTPLVATLTRLSAMNTSNKYYSTKWRFVPNYQGGYIFDGGVHEICKLRMMFGEVEEVTALVHQFKSDLPPADSVSATLRFKSGVLCTYTHTFTASALPVVAATISHEIIVSGTHGTINAKNNELLINFLNPTTNEAQRVTIAVENEQGQLSIRREIESFARAALGAPVADFAHYTPEQALQDVAIVQSILESASSGKVVKVPEIAQH